MRRDKEALPPEIRMEGDWRKRTLLASVPFPFPFLPFFAAHSSLAPWVRQELDWSSVFVSDRVPSSSCGKENKLQVIIIIILQSSEA